MGGGGGMSVRSDVTSGRNRRWEWSPDDGDTEDGKRTSDASRPAARGSDTGSNFADMCKRLSETRPDVQGKG